MGELLPMSRTYLRDSNHLQEELAALGVLPPNTKLFTFDAVSMYTNISISDGLTAFKALLIEYAHEVPKNFPTELFLKVLKIVMSRNVFQFDDLYYLQKIGTAMGTSAACMYATLYQALYE